MISDNFNKSKIFVFSFLGFAFALILFFFSLFVKTPVLSFSDAFKVLLKKGNENATIIVTQVRLPRTIAAFFCGAALSVSGLLLQLSLNNPLASPGVLGVNAGAGSAVLLSAILFPLSAKGSFVFAFLGSLCSVFFVYAISRKTGTSKTVVVLSGVAVSSLMTAFSDVLITFFPEIVVDKVAFSLGGFTNVLPEQLFISCLVVIFACGLAFCLSNGLDLFELGDETAYSLGLPVQMYRRICILISALLSASSVSICGLLGFVGLIVPNLLRLVIPQNCRLMIINSIFWGGGFVLLCDIIARLLFFPYEIPVGLIFSCLGTPFFIFLLLKKKRKHL